MNKSNYKLYRMKPFVFIFCILLFSFGLPAQNTMIDSLYKQIAIEKNDTSKAVLLYKLSYYYQPYKPDSACCWRKTLMRCQRNIIF